MRLLDGKGDPVKEKTFIMKRYILWRPFIVDLKDTRLPYGVPRTFVYRFDPKKLFRLDGGSPPPRFFHQKMGFGN